MSRFFLGITGASGHVYARAVLRGLAAAGHRIDLSITKAGGLVLAHEFDIPVEDDGMLSRSNLERFVGARAAAAVTSWAPDQVGAPAASGTTRSGGVLLVPCSMGTLARIAAGFSSNLVERAADVALKEGRPLLLLPREAPLSEIHLENMLRLKRMGATILPAMPGWYQRPASLEDLVNNLAGKVLDAMGVEHDLSTRWSDLVEPPPEAGVDPPSPAAPQAERSTLTPPAGPRSKRSAPPQTPGPPGGSPVRGNPQ
jgi:4-hydroxy-3-polyprenylbenzoate decarboxylase